MLHNFNPYPYICFCERALTFPLIRVGILRHVFNEGRKDDTTLLRSQGLDPQPAVTHFIVHREDVSSGKYSRLMLKLQQ